MADELPRPMAESWATIADTLEWERPWTTLFRASPPYGDWFGDGLLNSCVNCLDRHLEIRDNQVAIFWEGEPGDRRAITYRELYDDTLRLTASLRDMGVKRGDRVALHLGWIPETVVAILACARLGAEYTIIPVSLPVEALALRLDDFGPRVLFTQDGGWRRGAILPLKARADQALEATSGVQNTIVIRRTGVHFNWFEGDCAYDEIMAASPLQDLTPAFVPADHPMVAAYLANRGGRPVAVHHGQGTLAASAIAIHLHGLAAGKVFWCAGDLAWFAAQTHGVLGPLLAGATVVMYEGTLDVPAPDRAWQIIERYQVSSLLASPSVIRSLRGWSLAPPQGSTSSLQRVTTAGDRLDEDLRVWLSGALGESVAVADGWGQVELGGIVSLDPPVDPERLPNPGYALLDDTSSPVDNGTSGELVLLQPWPGTMRGIDVRGEDPTAAHWTRHPGVYATGDIARRNRRGQIEFSGRMDEVVSISGQLVSLNEVRDALLEQPFVAQAEVVERSDKHLGRALAAVVVLHSDAPRDHTTLRDLQDAVRELLGGLSRPRLVLVLDRFESDLDPAVRRRALTALASSVETDPAYRTWEQLLTFTLHQS
jgi:acetyl-CoA synthetase